MTRISFKEIKTNLTQEELQELNSAEKRKISFDNDSPEMTEDMLKEFKRINHQNRIKQTISLRLSNNTIQRAKSFGNKGYTSFLSRLLELAINNKEMIKQCL